jgi:hypothetical protein
MPKDYAILLPHSLPAVHFSIWRHGVLKKMVCKRELTSYFFCELTKQKILLFRRTFYKAMIVINYLGSSDGGRLWFSGTGLFSDWFWIKNGFYMGWSDGLVFSGYVLLVCRISDY